VSRMRVFFCQQYETTFRQLCNGRFSPNSASTRESSVKRRIRTEIYEKFPFRGHLAPKPQTSKGSNRYLTQSRLEVKGYTVERYCLLHVVVHARAKEFAISVNFTVRRTRLRSYGASKLPNFRTLAYFPHTKPRKRTFR